MPRAGEGIPINKELVVWARQRAGLTLEEAAQKFRHIAAWEDGSALPTYPQLESMADEFKLPIAVFFLPGTAAHAADSGVFPYATRYRI